MFESAQIFALSSLIFLLVFIRSLRNFKILDAHNPCDMLSALKSLEGGGEAKSESVSIRENTEAHTNGARHLKQFQVATIFGSNLHFMLEK